MLFASNKSKFHQQPRFVHYLKITSLLLIIITPFALLQFAILSNGFKKLNYDKHNQIPNQKFENQSTKELNNHGRASETIYKQDYDRKDDNKVNPINNPIIDGRVRELFDVNGYLHDSGRDAQPSHKSILRIRRQSLSEGLTTRPPQAVIDKFINNLSEAHDGNLELLKALERSTEEQAIKDALQDGQAVASERNGATALLGATVDDKLLGKTMVMVSSKSGDFNKLLSLDDLIVSPASETQLSELNLANQLATSASDQISKPDLAELTAAGTAAGLFLSGLAAQNGFASESHPNNDQFSGSEGTLEEVDQIERPIIKDLSSLHSYNEGSSTVPINTKENNQELEDQLPERMPDSMESLMGSEGEDLEERESDSNEPTQYAANEQSHQEIDDYNLQPIVQSQPVLDESDDIESVDAHQQAFENHRTRQKLSSLPSSNSLRQRYTKNTANTYPEDLSQVYPQTTPDGIMVNHNHQLMIPMRDSYRDLNAAAGHYYGKKKKKKKVVKKKKKVNL